MNLTDENRAKIDAMDYTALLERWRNAPVSDPWFEGETGRYWAGRMRELRSKPGGNEQHVAASKRIGWSGVEAEAQKKYSRIKKLIRAGIMVPREDFLFVKARDQRSNNQRWLRRTRKMPPPLLRGTPILLRGFNTGPK